MRTWPAQFPALNRAGIVMILSAGALLTSAVSYAAEPEKPKAGKPETVLLFEPAAKGQLTKEQSAKVIAVLDRRLNPGGLRSLFKRIQIEAIEGGRIRVTVPSADPVEVAKVQNKVLVLGSLEFRILADNRRPVYRSYIQRAEKLRPDQTQLWEDKKGDQPARVLAWWVPVTEKKEAEFQGNTNLGTRWVTDPKGRKHLEVLVLKDDYDVTGEYLTRATPGESKGKPTVNFVFNAEGAQKFGRLTGSHLEDPDLHFFYALGIILDGKLVTAPRIVTTIYGSGEITGDFTVEQVKELVDVLNAGALPVALRKVSPDKEATASPGKPGR